MSIVRSDGKPSQSGVNNTGRKTDFGGRVENHGTLDLHVETGDNHSRNFYLGPQTKAPNIKLTRDVFPNGHVTETVKFPADLHENFEVLF